MPIINKLLCDTLKINNPIDFIVSNQDNNEIISMLEKKFVRKCYMSALILRILRIVRKGSIQVNQSCIGDQYANPVYGTIDVEFEIEALVLNPQEILTGCIVRNNNDYNGIYCDTQYAGIYLIENKLHESLQVGQIVSIVVQDSVYEVFHEKIAVQAVLFIPHEYCIAYEVAQEGTDLLLDIKIPEYNIVSDAWKSFSKLIYPYKQEQAVTETKYSLLDLISKDTLQQSIKWPKYLVRDSRLGLATPMLWGANDTKKIKCDIIRGLSRNEVCSAIAMNYINYGNLIKGMSIEYNTPEIIKKHDNLWRIYGKVRL